MGFSAWLDTRANVDAFVWRPVQLATAMDSNLIFDDLWKYGNEACGGDELSDQRQGDYSFVGLGSSLFLRFI